MTRSWAPEAAWQEMRNGVDPTWDVIVSRFGFTGEMMLLLFKKAMSLQRHRHPIVLFRSPCGAKRGWITRDKNVSVTWSGESNVEER